MKTNWILAIVSVMAGVHSQPAPSQIPIPEKDLRITTPGSPFGAGWAFLYGYMMFPAATYMPTLRELGGGFTKVYLLWNQIEPEKGHYDWRAVDAFTSQLNSPGEGLISIFSSSKWATRVSTDMLPPSPAKNPDDYYRFIHDLVVRAKGRVRYWENDAEPNNPIYWSGTKEEFVSELKLFYKAVKDADPSATVIVGGYDGMFGLPGEHQFPGQEVSLAFFDHVLKEGAKSFDIFDLRLYGDPYTIVARVNFMRQKMLALGYDKPIFATEYGGPNFFELPVNRKYFTLIASWTQAASKPGSPNPGKQQIADMYKNMGALAPQTQMFMLDCPPELEAKYERIQARGLVMRNVLAFSAGVQKMLYWQFLHATGERDDLMTLMYGKIGMVGFDSSGPTKRYMVADVFKRMTGALEGVQSVKQVPVEGHPEIFMFEVTRAKQWTSYVAWLKADQWAADDTPPVAFDFQWPAKRKIDASDAFGQSVDIQVRDGRAHLAVSATPVFIQ